MDSNYFKKNISKIMFNYNSYQITESFSLLKTKIFMYINEEILRINLSLLSFSLLRLIIRVQACELL